jgi:tetratricopeptide (TPR) repeat protein
MQSDERHRLLVPVVVLSCFFGATHYWPVRPESREEKTAAGSLNETKTIAKQAAAAYSAQHWDEARSGYEALVKSSPDNPIYWHALSVIYHQQNDLPNEAKALEEVWDKSPTPIDACPGLPLADQRLHRPKEAFEAARHCYDLDQQNTDAIFALAWVYERRKDWKESRALYEKGLALAPSYTDMQIGLARLELFQGSNNKAISLAQAALKRNSRQPDALLVLGMAYRSGGQLAEARRTLEQALQITEEYPDVHLVLGQVAEDQMDFAEARRHYARAAELDPGGGTGVAALARIKGLEKGANR